MKPILFVLFTVLIVFSLMSVPSYSQSSFEGKIVMKITSQNGEKPTDVNYYIKGSKIRFEGRSEGHLGAMVMDTKNYTTLMLMPEQKMYMEFPYKHMMENVQKENEETKKEGNFNITNETKEINGYNCVKWIYKDDDGKTVEAWMTKALGSFLFFDNPMAQRNMPEWKRKLIGEGYFPMQVISKDENGKVDTQMEITSIEKKSLDESLFTPPPDYKKMEMPMMNQGN